MNLSWLPREIIKLRLLRGINRLKRDLALMATIDNSAVTPLLARLDTLATQLQATISGDVTAAVAAAKAEQAAADATAQDTAVAAQVAADQSVFDSTVADLNAKITALESAAANTAPAA